MKPFWPGDEFSEIADWCGVVGLLLAIVGVALTVYLTVTANRLKWQFQRRDLLPGVARRYQAFYVELAPVLSKPADLDLLTPKLGELRGMLNALEKYFDKNERSTLKSMMVRLDLIEKEPNAPTHFSALLQNAGTLSVELDIIVKEVKWNGQS